ncbi:MAG: AIR synthase [Clostridiales bacterium]|nr:AIR synthase [Clostridiales bacterium]
MDTINTLKIGKVPPHILKRSVFPFLGAIREEVLVHSGFGEDCSIIDFGEYVAVTSTDPITGANKNSGYLSVFISTNDIAACGAKPIGIMVTLLLPVGSDEQLLRDIMEGVNKGANIIGIEVLGGHSEITDAVIKPVLSVTALGIAKKDEYVTSSGAKPGDDVIVTKALGLEGTAILATDYEETLNGVLGNEMVSRAKGFIENIGVVEEGIAAAKVGVTAMHDITEGGILGAAYEVAEASGVGIEINKQKLPILAETKAICDYFKIDPLGLISSGSMLICAPKGKAVIEALESIGINASIVGKVTKEEKILICDHGHTKIIPPERDELYVAIERANKTVK